MDNIEMIPKSKDIMLFKPSDNNGQSSCRRLETDFFHMEASMANNDGEAFS
jgi:hypothetical protein